MYVSGGVEGCGSVDVGYGSTPIPLPRPTFGVALQNRATIGEAYVSVADDDMCNTWKEVATRNVKT